jgi:membrane protease YdiL (CAAX protease family)
VRTGGAAVDDGHRQGPVDGERPAWWRPTAPPSAPVISARRAYAEVFLVFAAFLGAGVANAVLALLGRLDSNATDPYSWARFGPAAFSALSSAGLAVALVVLLGRARGSSAADLGLRLRRDDRGKVRFWAELRVVGWAIPALILGGIVTAALGTGSLPPSGQSAANLVYGSARSVEAGFIEECVVLGFLIATLRQARRPTFEIIAVAVMCRISYHLYYGPGELGIVVWASVFVWLYLRTRSLVPLIAIHCFWDLVVTFSARWGVVAGLWFLAMLGVLVAAPISWLVERSRGPSAIDATRLPPPGWHRDPWDQCPWRWWDGVRWTATVSNGGDLVQPVHDQASDVFVPGIR